MNDFIGKIKLEDVILYAILTGILIFVGTYLTNQSDRISGSYLDGVGVAEIDTLNSVIVNDLLMYDFASRAHITNSSQNNMSFLIGSFLSIIGALIILRRVRNESIAAAADGPSGVRFNLETNSPGLFITLLGVIIICFTIYSSDLYDLSTTDKNPLPDPYNSGQTDYESGTGDFGNRNPNLNPNECG